MYEGVRDIHNVVGIKLGDSFIPFDDLNADYQQFKLWLVEQGKTLEQWLAEVPPLPTPTLEQAKVTKAWSIKASVDAELAAHYPVMDLLSFNGMFSAAIGQGLVNRAAYLSQLMVWAQQAYPFFYEAESSIIEASTVEEVEVVTLKEPDWSVWKAADPLITYPSANAIPN